LWVLITPPNPDVKWIVQDTFANLTFKGSVEVVYSDDGTDQLFVIEQVGVIKVFKNNPAASSTSDYNDGEKTATCASQSTTAEARATRRTLPRS